MGPVEYRAPLAIGPVEIGLEKPNGMSSEPLKDTRDSRSLYLSLAQID